MQKTGDFNSISMNNISLANLKAFDITLDSIAFFEFISYEIVMPFIDIVGLVTNLISIVTFLHSSLKGELYKFLLCHSIFTFFEFFFGLIFSLETLLNDWKIQSTIESARYELYFRHFACNFCSMMSIFCKIASLTERYADLKQNRFTKFLNKIPCCAFLSFMALLSLCCLMPILFIFKIDVLKNFEDFFENKIFLLSFKQERKYFLRKNCSYGEFLEFFENNTIYGLINNQSGSYLGAKYIIYIVYVLFNVGSILIIGIMIYLLLTGMQSRADKKRCAFFRSILNSERIKYELKRLNLTNPKNVEIIDAFDEKKLSTEQKESDDQNHLLIVYVKSAHDINKENLICLVISINFLLVLTRLLDLVYLVIKNLSMKTLIYYSVAFDIIRHLSNLWDLFLYLLFDRNFRKSYESIFKCFCYFKLHLPKKFSDNFVLKV
jgi:hypothetical protein